MKKIREFVEAGFDHVYIHQVGPEQEGFFGFYEWEILPALREPAATRISNECCERKERARNARVKGHPALLADSGSGQWQLKKPRARMD